MKFHETEEFKKQKKDWYQKLKESGFKDIEVVVGNEEKLRQYSKGYANNDKLDYYQALTYYVSSESFDNETDEFIMIRCSNGTKIKDISDELKKNSKKRSHRETIRYIIRKYEVRWGIKNYKPSQLSSKREKSGK